MLRRRTLEGDEYNPMYLRYWWCGYDDLVDGYLLDRMGTGADWSLGSNARAPLSSAGRYIDGAYIFKNRFSTNRFDLGHYYRFTADIDLKANKGGYGTIIDFGSITSASKNIGFSVETNGVSINWKLLGNNSNPGLAPRIESIFPGVVTTTGFTSINIDIFNKPADGYEQEYDYYYVLLNGEQKKFSCLVPQVVYSNMSAIDGTYLACGVADVSYSTQFNYKSQMYLRNIKIYVYS